jgi:16S rRNA (cytosine1402-N4)-methyltransferase
LLPHLKADARVLGIDKDGEVLRETARTLAHPGLRLVHGDFKDLDQFLDEDENGQAEGILMDLGVSSFQLDEGERGFSYHAEAELDMRMDREQPIRAADLVNQLPQEELSRIIFAYGEERFARQIARAIAKKRQEGLISTTAELAAIIKEAIPARYRRDKHPARRTFQALRIAVNNELDSLEAGLPKAVEALKPGGRLLIITFHSLEDRIVKRFYAEQARTCVCPPRQPVCNCNCRPSLEIVTKKAIVPGKAELAVNPRARSAKLRVARKIAVL